MYDIPQVFSMFLIYSVPQEDVLLFLSKLVSTWVTRVYWSWRTCGGLGKNENAKMPENLTSSLEKKIHLTPQFWLKLRAV